jgi:hypothetical protein
MVGTERRSMTMLGALMEDGETDKGCRDWVDGTFTGWWMTDSFTSAFVKCRMCFRIGTEPLLSRAPKNPDLPLGEGSFRHFG